MTDAISVESLLQDCEITYSTSSKPGGQRRDRKETAVRIRHAPTGVTVVAQENRLRSENLRIAKERLLVKVEKHYAHDDERSIPELPAAFQSHVTTGNRLICDRTDVDFEEIAATILIIVESYRVPSAMQREAWAYHCEA